MSAPQLFSAPVQSRETDERYTPEWIFAALGELFDLDPASPPAGVSRVPTTAVWTKDDDGLTRRWHGFVWCNPPFSNATAWADRFMAHANGIWLGPVANADADGTVLVRDLAALLDAADAVQRVRALHVADERPYELIWYGDEPCPTCHADGITTECDGHDTICCSACWQPHPEDSSIAGPVPYPCPTIRALEGPNRV